MKRLFNRKQSPPQSTTAENQVPPPPPPSSTHPTSNPPSSFPPQLQGLPPPPRVQNVGNAIGWSVSMPQFDFPYLLSLSDYLSSSSQASKDASKALRTEFKHGAPLAQERAVRLTGILMRNTDHRFRENVASKKFLGDLTDLVSSKKTEPPVKEMVYRVFSPLAYEYQRDDDLKSITQFFNKLLSTSSTSLTSFPSSLDPSSRAYQLNGAPLDPEDPLFTPTGLLPSSTTRSGRPSRRERGERGGGGIPKELEKVQMRELGERADKARGLARLLKEAVVFNKEEDAEELEKNEMVQEFQTQCLEEQNVLGENMVWATVQAEKSRQQLPQSNETETTQEERESGDGETTVEQEEMRRSRLSSNNPFAEVVNNNNSGGGGGTARRETERKTEEETILEKILLAHSEIQDSLSLLSSRLEQSRRERQHLQDLKTATELSKTYVKGGDDISREGGGNYGEGGSKQRWESVEDRERAEHEAMLREQEELDRYEKEKQQRNGGEATFVNPSETGANYSHDESIYSNSQNLTTTNTASPYDGLGALESLKGLDFSSPSPAASEQPRESQSAIPNSTSFSSSNPYSNLSLTTNNLGSTATTSATSPSQQDPFVESPISSTFLPPQPSEKALGKLRRISTTGRNEGEGEDDSKERQRILEEQLREKYRRNLEEQATQRRGANENENTNEGGIREV
ncbi:hypothetical protein JCM3765_000612 [Sporobolomyces pararoseus]